MNIQVLGKDSRGYFYHTGEKSARNVAITEDEYNAIMVAANLQKVSRRHHSWLTVHTIHFDKGFDYQPAQDSPKTHGAKRKLCAICKRDGATWENPAEATGLFVGKVYSESAEKIIPYRGYLCDMHADQMESGRFVEIANRGSES